MTLHQRAGSDEELVRRAQEGDAAAFEELIRRHRHVVLAVCKRATGDGALAAEAAQEAMVAAWLNLDQLRRDDRFGSWLVGIGLNMCRRLKQRRARQGYSLDTLLGGRLLEEPVSPVPGPAEVAEVSWELERVRAAIRELPAGQRVAAALYYVAGLTYDEVATHLGIQTGAVKSRLHKARVALRRHLVDLKEERTAMTDETGSALAMHVADVRRIAGNGDQPERHIVLVEERGGGRVLPIWVGESEAVWLALSIAEVDLPRPGPYHLMSALVEAGDQRVREVKIHRLAAGVFYAAVMLENGARVDARPSDALNLAVVTGAPVYVDGAVLAAGETSANECEEELEELRHSDVDARALATST